MRQLMSRQGSRRVLALGRHDELELVARHEGLLAGVTLRNPKQRPEDLLREEPRLLQHLPVLSQIVEPRHLIFDVKLFYNLFFKFVKFDVITKLNQFG